NRKSTFLDQLTERHDSRTETTNCDSGTVDGDRGNCGVHTGTVGKTGVNHGGVIIETTTQGLDDLVDGLSQVSVVFENNTGFLQTTVSFHIYRSYVVDTNITDGRVTQQGTERTESEYFIEYVLKQNTLFHHG